LCDVLCRGRLRVRAQHQRFLCDGALAHRALPQLERRQLAQPLDAVEMCALMSAHVSRRHRCSPLPGLVRAPQVPQGPGADTILPHARVPVAGFCRSPRHARAPQSRSGDEARAVWFNTYRRPAPWPRTPCRNGSASCRQIILGRMRAGSGLRMSRVRAGMGHRTFDPRALFGRAWTKSDASGSHYSHAAKSMPPR